MKSQRQSLRFTLAVIIALVVHRETAFADSAKAKSPLDLPKTIFSPVVRVPPPPPEPADQLPPEQPRDGKTKSKLVDSDFLYRKLPRAEERVIDLLPRLPPGVLKGDGYGIGGGPHRPPPMPAIDQGTKNVVAAACIVAIILFFALWYGVRQRE